MNDPMNTSVEDAMDDSVAASAVGRNRRASPARTSTHAPLVERLVAISRDSVLEEMASGISHELNQPLGAIVTFAQAGERMLDQPDVSIEQAREVFRLISKEGLAAADGIRRMRRLFHRDAPQRDVCAMGEVVVELQGVLALLASNLDVRLSMQIDRDLPSVCIDRLRIQHVVFALSQNAIEASASGNNRDPLVSIKVSGDRYGVEVAVIDTGPGIAAAHRAQIFHPFFTTRRHGTGLGLASARAIVEAHEGTIGFEAEPGEPTRFWFRIPATSK
jgi:two-component system sensor kinase FixL